MATTTTTTATTGKANLAPAKPMPVPGIATIAKAPMVPYLAPARPNLPTASAPAPVPGMVPQGASIAWHGSNGNANLYPRFNALPAGAMVKAGPVPCSAKRLHGYLAPVLAKALGNGPVLWGTIANLPVTGAGQLQAHLTYLTGHGILVLA